LFTPPKYFPWTGILITMIITLLPTALAQSNFSATSHPAGRVPVAFDTTTLVTTDGEPLEFFGYTVALDGDTAVVGAPNDDDQGPYSGSAYVFVRQGNTWVQQAKLLASNGNESDLFGKAVALSGNTVLIGASGDDDQGPDCGAVYVFVRQGEVWVQQAKLLATDGNDSDFFGGSVALERNTALIGAPADDDRGLNSGSAYVFARQRGAWVPQAKLLAGDGAAEDTFGAAVSLAGARALLGSPLDDDRGANSGSAYVFVQEQGSWRQEAKLLSADGSPEDYFGTSLALSGNTALVGAFGDDDLGSASGSAYVFVRQTDWLQQAKLLAADGAQDDYFSFSLALDGDRVLIGAYGDKRGPIQGAAYLYERQRGSWTQQAKVKAQGGATSDIFGFAVALSNDTFLIGTLGDNLASENSSSTADQGVVYAGSYQP